MQVNDQSRPGWLEHHPISLTWQCVSAVLKRAGFTQVPHDATKYMTGFMVFGERTGYVDPDDERRTPRRKTTAIRVAWNNRYVPAAHADKALLTSRQKVDQMAKELESVGFVVSRHGTGDHADLDLIVTLA